MKRYQHRGENTGVLAYETGPDFIRVKFVDNAVYLYTHASTGEEGIAEMKRRAASGRGLATYINQHVRKRYACKEKGRNYG